MYLHYTPKLLQKMFPRYTWRREVGEQKKIYLTFDDGPVPEMTPFVLEVLREYGAKATFFCVGENVEKQPDVFQQLLKEGHGVGNHTYNHLKGWETGVREYIENVQKCEDQIIAASGSVPTLFRPPYGRIRKDQAKVLLSTYEIIMWDVLSADYDASLNKEKCLNKSIRHTLPGSIVVFHDNIKAFKNLSWVLPRYLDHFKSRGFSFEIL